MIMEKEELVNLKTDDILKATLEAREKSMKILEEQDITTIAFTKKIRSIEADFENFYG